MTSFNAGVSGLHSAQQSLTVTSHNLANAGTVGYTRQQVLVTDSFYQKSGSDVQIRFVCTMVIGAAGDEKTIVVCQFPHKSFVVSAVSRIHCLDSAKTVAT